MGSVADDILAYDEKRGCYVFIPEHVQELRRLRQMRSIVWEFLKVSVEERFRKDEIYT